MKLDYKPKESSATATVSVWARQFGGNAAAPAPRAPQPAAVVRGSGAIRPSTESVWAKQFNKAPAAAPATPPASRQVLPTASAFAAGLGFKFSDIRASASTATSSPAQIRALIRSGRIVDCIEANDLLGQLRPGHPETFALAGELADAIAPKTSS